jgi:hypothetical protein
VDCKYHSLWGRWSSSEVNGLYGVGLKEKYQKRLQEILLDILYLRWVMTLRLDFDMTCGVRGRPLS